MRGLDVFELAPSEYLSENEIAAARLADQGGTFNPQQQNPVTWPDHPVVALAYLDQLNRSQVLADDMSSALSDALERAVAVVDENGSDAELAGELDSMAADLNTDSDDAMTASRLMALHSTMEGVAEALR